MELNEADGRIDEVQGVGEGKEDESDDGSDVSSTNDGYDVSSTRQCKQCGIQKTKVEFSDVSYWGSCYRWESANGICEVCEEEKCEEHNEAVRQGSALPRQCEDCREEKSAEHFLPPTTSEFNPGWLEPVESTCKVCLQAKERRRALHHTLLMKRVYNSECFTYEPDEDELSFVQAHKSMTQEQQLRQNLLGKYHIVYIRLIPPDDYEMNMQRAVYNGGTVTLQEKILGGEEQTTANHLICGEISLWEEKKIFEWHRPTSWHFNIVEENTGEIVSDEGEPRPKRANTDWALDLDLPNYNRPEDDEGVDPTHGSFLKPHGFIKVIARRHSCPWLSSDNPFCRASDINDRNRRRLEMEIERKGRQSLEEEIFRKCLHNSWICRHFHLPFPVARIIHDFVAWRPDHEFFFEPGDLWINLKSKWERRPEGDGEEPEDPANMSCYFIARPASKYEEKIKIEQVVQNALKNREWEAHCRELIEYREHHGDCSVPMDYKNFKVRKRRQRKYYFLNAIIHSTGPPSPAKLANWVYKTRKKYHLSELTEEQILELNKIGFIWIVCFKGDV